MKSLLSSAAVLTLLVLLVGNGGCSSAVSVPQWQKSVQDYVAKEGNGDPSVLGDLTLPKTGSPPLKGFGWIGGDQPQDSTDAMGVLLGHKPIGPDHWFVYLVGLNVQQQVTDIRIAAYDPNEKNPWRTSAGNNDALRMYKGYWTGIGKQRFPQREDLPPQYSRFPRPDDRFELSITDNHVTVTHTNSGAQWKMDVNTSK